ncbi:hypothetical protein C923_04703 [Plasmodium falciparum UGT5.1]|uniref:Uncharacterized protein n=4 Tax=Plasmodium falciparum TaxID=5833 RepID=W4IYT7_PLAFP|nr:hypothetical protein PFFVO_04223 [Plasmodium falciparum Vietnam Oak-Knoll (FVO)]ETW41151.1 hypothetical protein PFNF135_04785 [Plasmodium falciparum NF135/5.C10]ETW54501.1 hypothetical protein PFUGPA_03109 [Plasmodium falciparum Palo Alto/Uganda]EWC74649.1 hypothetical protein C923_04703 [Plasmodium falciparum UGT5.1]
MIFYEIVIQITKNHSIIQEDIKNTDNNAYTNNDYNNFQSRRGVDIKNMISICVMILLYVMIIYFFQNKDQMIKVVFNEYNYNKY